MLSTGQRIGARASLLLSGADGRRGLSGIEYLDS